MKSVTRGLTVVVLLAMPVVAADPPGFKLWKAGELKEPTRRCRRTWPTIIRRARRWPTTATTASACSTATPTATPSSTTRSSTSCYVQSGEGTLALGGTMVGTPDDDSPASGSGRGSTAATVIHSAAGDIVHIPAGIPHSFLVPEGKHITYVLLKIPAK